MLKVVSLKTVLLFIALLAVQSCGGDEPSSTASTEEKKPMAVETPAVEPVEEETQREIANETVDHLVPEPAPELEHDVVYQEEIYKNWPYQEEARKLSPADTSQQDQSNTVEQTVTDKIVDASEEAKEMLNDAVEEGKDMVAAVVPGGEETAANDKPYQVVDGNISQNAIEGWKTYNGGGCGACHGKGGQGAVGPALGASVTQKLSKEQFINIVTNGVSGTMMRPHKTNKRVMDNLDNLYAYLVARGDGVLGPGNLIKFPMGKQ